MNIDLTYLDYQVDVFFNWGEGIKYKVVPKGRRSGITKGAANAIIEYLLEGSSPVLWGDTIHGNIDRYFQRYFLPELKNNQIPYHWDQVKKQLTIRGNFCDFRSADNPENWEGFGYKYIFLNEAGIILKNRDLYTNTVLPMMLDFKDSRLIAAGVPKGKLLKDGAEHPFFTLYKRAVASPSNYKIHHLTSYANPLLSEDGIKDLETEMGSISPTAILQEIYGEFIDTDAVNPFAFQFDEEYHVGEPVINYNRQLYISMDFNLNPYAVTFWQVYKERNILYIEGIDEFDIPMGNIPTMIDRIKALYGQRLMTAIITGDAMGNQRNMARRDNASHYMEIIKGLNLGSHQLKTPANPTHENSRPEVNAMLHMAKEETQVVVRMHPKRMKNTIMDFKIVQCDAFDSIIKRNRNDLSQRADFLDTARSLFHLVNLQFGLHKF